MFRRRLTEGNDNGESGARQHSSKRRPPPFPSSRPPSRPHLLSQDNFDVFVAAVVKLLPASFTVAAPHAPAAAAAAAGASLVGMRDRAREGAGRCGAVRRGVPSSPYEEVECLGMTFECLVEACTESLDSGAW